MELPKYLKSGEVARLIPVVADTSREQRAASTLLAVISAVPEFANALFQPIGHSVGKFATVNTYTEVVFQKGHVSKERPDGLLEIKRGKKSWSALIELKIGKSAIQKDQIERYIGIARSNDLDAVISVSNEFATRPDHPPIQISKALTRKVGLFHFSWSAILTEALLLQGNAAVTDPDRAFILREFIRFLSHDAVGVTGFELMPEAWKKVIDAVQANVAFNKMDPNLEAVVSAWHQEIRDLALIMTRSLELERAVDVKLKSSHRTDPMARMKDDTDTLRSSGILSADLLIPNAASEMTVTADLRGRAIHTSMTVDAPTNKKQPKARVNWLLRQLKSADAGNVLVKVIWPHRQNTAVFPLLTLQENPKVVEEVKSKVPPKAFEVYMTSESARRFAGRKTFIEDVEKIAPTFYDKVGQHLERWHPKPPKPKKPSAEEQSDETPPRSEDEKPKAGNEHTSLLEIPTFLKRW